MSYNVPGQTITFGPCRDCERSTSGRCPLHQATVEPGFYPVTPCDLCGWDLTAGSAGIHGDLTCLQGQVARLRAEVAELRRRLGV